MRSIRRVLRRFVARTVVSAAMLSTSAALADGRAELEKARASFRARNWPDAEERLRVLVDPTSGLKERQFVSQASMYLGAALLAQGKTDEAKATFEKLVLDDPTFDPDPLSFPSDAINMFIDVRSSLLEQIKSAQQAAARLAAERRAKEEAEREAERVWLEKVKAQAAEETITVRHHRMVASLPFGAGQFQNGQPVVGWVFLGAEVAAVAGTVVTYGMYRYARGRESDELNRASGDIRQLAPQYHQRADNLRIVNLTFAASFVAVAALGIVQSHLNFVPESREKKKRDLPPQPTRSRSTGAKATRSPLVSIAPVVSALPGTDGRPSGVFFGLEGATF